MIISDEKMKKHYETFVKCVFHDGKFSDANMKRAFELVTREMMLEVRDAAKNAAFDAAHNISHLEVK